MSKRFLVVILSMLAASWCAGQTNGPAGDPISPPAGIIAALPVSPASRPEVTAQRQQIPPAPLTAEQRDEMLDFLKAEQPDLYKQLDAIRAAAPASYEAMLSRLYQTTSPLMEMKRSDPALYAIYKEEMDVSRKIARIQAELIANRDKSRDSQLLGELRQQLNIRFDLAQDRQKLLIAKVKAQTDRLINMLQTRQANRDKIIEEQVQQIQTLASHVQAEQNRAQPGGAPFGSPVAPPNATSPAASGIPTSQQAN